MWPDQDDDRWWDLMCLLECSAVLLAAVSIIVLVAVDIGIHFVDAGTRVSWHCEGDSAVYTGRVHGTGVLVVNSYDSRCAAPMFGESQPIPTPTPAR